MFLQSLAPELVITIADPAVWLAIGQGLLFGGVSLVFGIWVARRVGLLASDAPAGETLGLGLASGLMVLAAWWAAIWSGGRSSFTPVAIGFAIAIVLAVLRRAPTRTEGDAVAVPMTDIDDTTGSSRWSNQRPILMAALAGGIFIVAVALLYGATMAPSPRDGVQPVENRDETYYAVLGRDLATTGTESNNGPSGFSEIPGAPVQIWYHWGELWLASAAITIFGAAPVAARFFIVLPVVLLATAALTGSIVRRMARTDSRWAYLFGFVACLFLAPVALIPGPFFSTWATGMISSVVLFGLGAVAGLLGLYSAVSLSGRAATWALAVFVGSAIAFIIPAHIAVALLAAVGVGIGCAIQIMRSARSRRRPIVAPIWVRTLISAGVAVGVTAAWGVATGHSIGGGAPASTSPPVITPFNQSWRESVAITFIGAGLFFAIPVAWLMRRRERPLDAVVYVATIGLLVAGAIGWGARLADFTMFYLFFAPLSVLATAIAAGAVRTVWDRLRETQHRMLALGLVVLCFFQLEAGAVSGIIRLQGFGVSDEKPISLGLLDAIRQLPLDGKLAYSCGPFDEVAFGAPQLSSIDAHTARRVVPMCFEAELPNTLLGAAPSVSIPSQFFVGAPQADLYPTATARPSSADVTAFMHDHGIDYIYADAKHPNTLVDDAVAVATSGGAEILRLP